jgi:fatty-acyl-CoA synthase
MNLSRIIQHWAQMSPAKCALRFEGEEIGYAALWERIEAATCHLLSRGVEPGDRVAYLGLNHPDYIAMLMALARIGAVSVPLNFRLAAAELAHVLTHAEASLLFTDASMAKLANQAATLAEGVPVADAGELRAPPAAHAKDLVGSDDSDVLIVYTSGTTGKPKGAVHTQANLLWNIASATAAQDLTSNDHMLSVLPIFHVGGLCILTLPVLAAGGTVTLHPRFEPGAWLRDVRQLKPTVSLLVPATIKAIFDHPDWPGADLSCLRFLNTGSSVIPLAMIEAFHARGVPVSQVYGATETGPVSIVLRPQDGMAHPGSAGKAALHVEVRLTNRDGAPVAPGAVGEIRIKGRNVMRGYWKDAHNPAFVDGWFATGDLARQDEAGYYYVVGRSKDMIISGGENIYPAELENLLADCPLIAEAAVVGAPDEKWGEVAVAAVVLKPGARMDAASVLALFEGRLARYKHPRRVLFVETLPKTALGKVQKPELKSLLRLG